MTASRVMQVDMALLQAPQVSAAAIVRSAAMPTLVRQQVRQQRTALSATLVDTEQQQVWHRNAVETVLQANTLLLTQPLVPQQTTALHVILGGT